MEKFYLRSKKKSIEKEYEKKSDEQNEQNERHRYNVRH